MKILCAGDIHITNKKPKNRTDNYFETVLNKFNQILQIAHEEGCPIVLLPGDVFDSSKESHYVVQEVIHAIRKYPDLYVMCVAGQHDQNFHNSDLSGTALATLLASGIVILQGAKPSFIGDKVAIYGASWKDEIPEIITPDHLNILLIHKMIVEEKLWAAQEGHTWANHMLSKSKFDLVISGDNHNQFTAIMGGNYLINIGSLVRSTIAQLNHRPSVVIYDTDTRTITRLELDIKPFEEVMCIAKAEKEKEKSLQLEAFVASLKDGDIKDGQTIKLSFVGKLHKYLEDNDVDEDVSVIIFEAMEQ